MNGFLRDLIDKLKDSLKKSNEKIIAIIVLGILAGFIYYANGPQKLVILCIIAIAGIAGYQLTYNLLKRRFRK